MTDETQNQTQAPAAPQKASGVKTFFAHIYEFLKEHLGSASSLEHTASTTIKVASPLLLQLVGEVAGDPVEAKVKGVVNQVTTDLDNTSALLDGAEAGDADHSVAGFLGSAQKGLSTLIADADVKNSAKATKITAIANTVLGEISAILSALPADHSVPVVGETAA